MNRRGPARLDDAEYLYLLFNLGEPLPTDLIERVLRQEI